MDHKQRSLSKLFEKQATVSLDDLSDDEEQSLASESKASIAGHLRSMLTRSASRMSMAKDSATDRDDESIASTSEGSVYSARSALSRTASGISSGLRRGSQLLRSSSFRSIGSFRQNKHDTSKSTLYGSHDDSSNSSLESLGTSGEFGRRDLPSAQQGEPEFDLTMMKIFNNGKETTVNEDDRSTVWVKSGEKGEQHLQLDIRNHASGSLMDMGSQEMNHSSSRSLELDQLGSSNPSIFSSKGSTESCLSSELGESHHSRHLVGARRRRRPRRYSIDQGSSGTGNSTATDQTLGHHMSVNRIGFEESGKGKDSDVLSSSKKSTSGTAACALKNPRRRRTQRPKGFSNMKLHSSSGSLDDVDFYNEKADIDRIDAQNEKWTNDNPPEASLGQNLLLNKLNKNSDDGDPVTKILHRQKSDSKDKLRGLSRHSSGRSCLKAPNVTLSQDMLSSLGRSLEVKFHVSNASTKSQKSVSRTVSFDQKKPPKAPSRSASHRSISLVNVNARQINDDGVRPNESWSCNVEDAHTTNDIKAQNMLLKQLNKKSDDRDPENKVLNRRRSDSKGGLRGLSRNSSGRSCLKAPNATLSKDMLSRLGQSLGVKSDLSKASTKSRKSVSRTVSFGEGMLSKAPVHSVSHRSVSLVDVNARQGSDDGIVQNEAWGFDLGDRDTTNDTQVLKRRSGRRPKKDSSSRSLASLQSD